MEEDPRASAAKAQAASAGISATPAPDPGSTSGAFFPGGVAFYSGNPSTVHPYSIFAGQAGVPLVYGGPFYGGILPYGFPSAAPAPSLPANGRQEEPGGEAAQESGQTDGSGDRAEGQQRLRATSSHSQQPESPQPTQSGYTMVTAEAGATSTGAAALAALAAAQAQVAGTPELRQAAELWHRQRSALESAADLPSLGSGEGTQDDREVKRLRRKQSNRESARRSRLRKQAECESLSGKVEELMNDNARLKEANRLLQARVDALTAQPQADTDDRTRQKPDDTAKAPEDVHMQSQALPASTPAPWPLGTDLRA